MPDALHVQVIAPFDRRVTTLVQRQNVERTAAEKLVQKADRRRASYLRRIYSVGWLDPMHYHLVLSTGRMYPKQAASLVVQAVRLLEDKR